MSAHIASWHATLCDATPQERWEIFCIYCLLLVVRASFIANVIVYGYLEKWKDRHGILRWSPAIGLATFEGLIVLGLLGAYIVLPSLIAGRFLSPTCAARWARKGDEAMFCLFGRLAPWLFRFCNGKRDAELGEYEPSWKSLVAVSAFTAAALVLLIPMPSSAKAPEKTYTQESKGPQT